MQRQTLQVLAAACALLLTAACQAEPEAIQGSATMSEPAENLMKATFGNGCFWCTEAIYERVEGVHSAVSGYAGGEVPNPTYEAVCTGSTGHAEVVQLTYDPEVVAYETLLDVFFSTHDPTTLNRQGNDVGTQYRSVIFAHSAAQKAAAKAKIEALEEAGTYDDPIVTQLEDEATFYPAKDYHQEYFARNPNQGYCRMVIAPKVKKFEQGLGSKVGK